MEYEQFKQENPEVHIKRSDYMRLVLLDDWPTMGLGLISLAAQYGPKIWDWVKKWIEGEE